MKKLFFFRSSNSSTGTNQISPTSTDKQVYWEKPSDEQQGKSRIKNQDTEKHDISSAPSLRRSRSFSSTAIFDGEFGPSNMFDPNGSSCSTNYDAQKQMKCNTSRLRTLTPERKHRSKLFEPPAVEVSRRLEKPTGSFSRELFDSSDCSSYCSSNVSSGVLDRYVDGEQQYGKDTRPVHNRSEMGNNHQRNLHPHPHPSVVLQHATSGSPTNRVRQKPKVKSFRETNTSQLHLTSNDWGGDNGISNTSPQKLAKHVVERLSQSTRHLPKKMSSSDHEFPITVEDIYCGNLSPKGNSDRFRQKDYNGDVSGKSHLEEDHPSFAGRNSYVSSNSDVISDNTKHEDAVDLKLFRKFKDSERRAMLLSQELEEDNFDNELSFQALNGSIRGLKAERVEMAYQISSILKDWISDRTSLREELKVARSELDSKTRRLEKEKNDLQSSLEKELDRRSSDWSTKLEKYRAEENRLRERVRELAEQNVSLQREISSFGETETDTKNKITSTEQLLESETAKMEEIREENSMLQKTVSEITEKLKVAEEDRDLMRRNFDDKSKECKDLHRSITRLQRTCNEQEKTIDGLRCLCEEIQENSNKENFDNNQIGKLRKEQIRLTGVEHALRKEVESYRADVESLRFENINLLNRLKDSGKDGAFSTFKLDQELWHRICCLQNQGLSFLAESTHMCSKLLEYIKNVLTQDEQGRAAHGLDSQFIVECEVKLQGLSRGIETLTKSLSVVSTVLHEKSQTEIVESQQKLEDVLQSELKAETLLTTLLREKLYSKEMDIEQLQAELAAAVRGNDILKAEVQNAFDTLSCLTHKMKDLELQMIKKDDSNSQLQNQLQDCAKELNIVKGVLPKVSEERDIMWGEIKKYSEENMLLNSQVNQLKKKVEVLDEEVLYKEGQIAILKDALGKPFDLLASPDSVDDKFLVK